ncbi:MAG: hypothetical protein VB070_04380 [Clostridiaceae bacterium]|nr:hypothetical protein [Clostridiaceae bacterium]
MTRYEPCERETIIKMSDEDNGAQISTYQESVHRQILKLAEANPDIMDPVHIRNYSDGLSTNVAFPSDWISIRPPKRMNLSEAQKKIRTKRLKEYRGKAV